LLEGGSSGPGGCCASTAVAHVSTSTSKSNVCAENFMEIKDGMRVMKKLTSAGGF
jgi:hypothetical protein